MSVIVLIEGGTSSGKSTLADFLCHNLRKRSTVSLIKQDDYYKDLGSLSEEEIETYNFDTPEAIDLKQFSTDLNKLANGEKIQRRSYNFKEHRNYLLNEWIEPSEIIIGEGLFVFNADIESAIRVFIDIDDDIRLIRRLQRDKGERGIPSQKTIEHYLNTVKPMHEKYIKPLKEQADILLSDLGEKPVEKIAETLIDKLKGYIE